MDLSSFNLLSICAGVGGIDLGLRIALPNARTVCMVEREAFACEILATRMREGSLDEAPIWSDLGTFNCKPWRGVVDCIAAGLPCQPYSVAGQRRGDKDERYIWPDFFRIVSEVEPAVVFLENVPGFVAWFRPVGEELCRLGYEFEAGIFSAAEVGASHRRERFFVLAHSNGWCLERRESDGHKLCNAEISEGSDDYFGRSSKIILAHAGCSERRWRSSIAGSTLAYSNSPGLEESEWRSDSVHEPVAECRPLFPPGPGGCDEWQRILERWPELAPAAESEIRFMAHESASRLDQLRALGNSVVPLQAAYAFKVLARKADLI